MNSKKIRLHSQFNSKRIFLVVALLGLGSFLASKALLAADTTTTKTSFFPGSISYELDLAHSQIGFKIDHLMISSVSGRFKEAKATFEWNENQKEFKNIQVTIQSHSINTEDPKRDAHLQSPDFFDTQKFPEIRFSFPGTKTVKSGETFPLKGELTLKGIKKEITLNTQYKGTIQDPWKNARLVFSAEAKINRKDFGLTWNNKLDSGGLVLGEEVSIQIVGEALPVPVK